MDCPVCRAPTLAPHELTPGLTAAHCPICAGNWISTARYWLWRDHLSDHQPESTSADPDSGDNDSLDDFTLATDVTQPKRCPDDGAPLLPYRVGHGLAFRIDRCVHCHGVWFDADEWETLRRRHLHGDVHRVFTSPWQNALAHEEHHRSRHTLLAARFGASDWARIQQVKTWLDHNPERHALLAYLSGDEE